MKAGCTKELLDDIKSCHGDPSLFIDRGYGALGDLPHIKYYEAVRDDYPNLQFLENHSGYITRYMLE